MLFSKILHFTLHQSTKWVKYKWSCNGATSHPEEGMCVPRNRGNLMNLYSLGSFILCILYSYQVPVQYKRVVRTADLKILHSILKKRRSDYSITTKSIIQMQHMPLPFFLVVFSINLPIFQWCFAKIHKVFYTLQINANNSNTFFTS